MRFDRVQVHLEPLSTSNCLDMAVLFLCRYLNPVAKLISLFAVPCCAAVYFLVYQYEYDLRLPILLFYFASSPLGVLLIVGAASASFGEKFSWSQVLRTHFGLILRLLVKGLLLRLVIGVVLVLSLLDDWDIALKILLGIVLCLFPGIWLAIRTGFFVERGVLAKLSHHLHETRGSTLIRKRFGDISNSVVGISIFCGLLWFVCFMSSDLAIDFLFHIPIFTDRIGFEGEIALLLWSDPKVLSLMLGCAFLVYPVGRLAWFFTYIDLRVRRDCWDMELEMLQEAQRLEGVA